MNAVPPSTLWMLLLLAGLVPIAGCGDRDAVAPVKPEAITEPDVVAEEPVAPVEWREATSGDGRYFVRWRPLAEPIPMADPFDVEVEIWTDETMTEAGDYDTVIVDAGMPHHGHGMNVRPEHERRADGSWVARGMLMHMPGRWQVYVDVFDDGRLERAQWSMWLSG